MTLLELPTLLYPLAPLPLFQALNPFYLFQAYTVILWSVQFYWKFAVVIAVTSVIAVTVSVWETRRVRSECVTHIKHIFTLLQF